MRWKRWCLRFSFCYQISFSSISKFGQNPFKFVLVGLVSEDQTDLGLGRLVVNGSCAKKTKSPTSAWEVFALFGHGYRNNSLSTPSFINIPSLPLTQPTRTNLTPGLRNTEILPVDGAEAENIEQINSNSIGRPIVSTVSFTHRSFTI